MELGCLFPPGLRTPAHIEQAEALGYRRAYVYDSPAFLADPWMTLALAAGRTTRIALGVCAITPRLRHVVATAGALATLAGLAPGRAEAVLGSGFTSQLMLAQRPARWAEVEPYAAALRALLAGDETEWEGGVIGLKHGPRSGCHGRRRSSCGSPRTARVGTRPRPARGRHRHQPLPPRRQPGAPGHEPGPGAVLRHGAGPRGGPGQRAGP